MNNSRFISPLSWILTFFLLLFIYTKFLGPIPFSINSTTTTKSDTFNVSGEGKVSVIPDAATVSVGVRSRGTTVKEAQDQLNSSINKVIESIKSLGVDSKDIQTANYNINPDYDFTGGPQRIKGYTASSTVSIKLKDTGKVNSVIDAATQNGANEVFGINFEVSDKTKAENEAREKAVAEAKRKAQSAAKIAGFKLGKIINYSEDFIGGPVPYPLRVSADSKEAQVPTQVEPGSTDVVVNVTLSYEVN